MKQDYNHIYESCKDHMHAYVLLEMTDGTKLDGIITGLDDEHVYLAVPTGDDVSIYNQQEPQRQFGYGAPGYGYGHGYGYGYGSPYGHQRPRFRRVVLPLTFLAALSLLPWY